MTPLQKIAMGLVIVFLSVNFPAHPSPDWLKYDVLANPLGWVLVFLGVWALRRTSAVDGLLWGAGVAGAVSVPLWLPQLSHQLPASGEWFASLPQLAFCFLLCQHIQRGAGEQSPPDGYARSRFGLLRWAFVALAILPVFAIGGGVTSLQDPTVLASVLVSVSLVYFLFKVHGRRWLGGNGPREWPATARE